jgi:uncharacterized UBP type Zn finger protein
LAQDQGLDYDENSLKELIDMGFKREDAIEALSVSGGDKQVALNYLMQKN